MYKDLQQLKASAIDLDLAALNIIRADADECIAQLAATGERSKDNHLAKPFQGGDGGLLFGGMDSIDHPRFRASQIKPDRPRPNIPEITGAQIKAIARSTNIAPLPWLGRDVAVSHADRYDWRFLDRDIPDDLQCGKRLGQWRSQSPLIQAHPDVIAAMSSRGNRKYETVTPGSAKGEITDWATLARIDEATFERCLREPSGCNDDDERSLLFWEMVRERKLPIVITEGIKKALSGLSAGIITLSVPGVWMGTDSPNKECDRQYREHVLSPSIAAFRDAKCSITIAFDSDEKVSTRRTVAKAVRRLAWAIKSQCSIASWPTRLGKGMDDVIASGHNFQAIIDRAMPSALWRTEYLAGLSYNVTRTLSISELDQGKYIPKSFRLPSPDEAKIVALVAPKGSGKTEAIARHLAGQTILNLTHRLSLGTATANRLGLESLSDISYHGGQGSISAWLCIDSLHEKSQARFDPNAWANMPILIDEICQFVIHILTASTAIQKRRAKILSNLQTLLRGCIASPRGQLLAADADLNDIALNFVAAMLGTDHAGLEQMMQIIEVEAEGSTAKRRCYSYATPADLFGVACGLIDAGKKILWHLASQKVESKWGSQTLETELKRLYPELRILRYDADTIGDRDHPAYRVARDLNNEISNWDVILATPSMETGVSIDGHHFDAVFGLSHGGQTADSFRQSLARNRSDIDRHIFVPARATHGFTDDRATSPRALIEASGKRSKQLRQQFRQWAELADADYTAIDGATEAWAKFSALQNARFEKFRSAIETGLAHEGYEIIRVKEGDRIDEITESIESARDENMELDSAQVSFAENIDEKAREKLAKATSLTATERRQLRKATIADRLAKPVEEITTDDVDRDRDGWITRTQKHFYLTHGREFAAELDRYRTAKLHLAEGGIFARDAIARNESMRLIALDKLGFTELVSAVEADPMRVFVPGDFDRLAATWTACASDARRWGIGASIVDPEDDKLGIKLARELFKAIGLKLATTKRAGRGGDREMNYRITSELDEWTRGDGGAPSPFTGDDRLALFERWKDRFATRSEEWAKARSEWVKSHESDEQMHHEKDRTISIKEKGGTTPETPSEKAIQRCTTKPVFGVSEHLDPDKITPEIEPIAQASKAPIAPQNQPAIAPRRSMKSIAGADCFKDLSAAYRLARFAEIPIC